MDLNETPPPPRGENRSADGLRLAEIWVPDTSAPGFAEECRRQCLVLAAAETRDCDVDKWLEANNQALAAEIDELEV